jgi:MFS family permease
LSDDAEFSWGWRVPFWLSAIVVVVAYFIRRRLHETPQFTEIEKAGAVARIPLLPLLRNHWVDVVRVIFCAFIAAVSTVFGTLAIAYGKKVGLDTGITLWLVVVANAVALFTQPLFGKLADRIGRKPVFIYGALSSAVLMPFYMLSMSSGNAVLTFALAVSVFSFGYAAANAVWPSFYGEMFSTNVRFSGMAIGTQIGFLLAGFAPSIVTRARRRPRRWLGRHQHFHRRRVCDRRDIGVHRQGNQGRSDRATGRQVARVEEDSGQRLSTGAAEPVRAGPTARIGSWLVRAVLIVNPNATSTTRAGRDLLAHALESRAKLAIAHTDARGHAIDIARDAAADGVDLLIVHGGTGR